MAKRNFFKELKRRNVYKVAITYAIITWMIAQIGSIVFPAIQAPDWIMQALLFFLAVGFPIALILAWAFEMSPEGMIRTTSVASEDNPYSQDKKKPLTNNLIIGALLIVVVGQFVHNKYWGANSVDIANTEKSIAVLPFTNESSNVENQYFCNGIMEGILDHLAKIPDLSVTSRTSVEQYRVNPPSSRNIGEELGVEYLVEGSVQRVDDRAIIVAQLIFAENDKHIWSDRYTVNLTDIFAIQAEITEAIASELQTIIAPEIKQQIQAIPTKNPVAYDNYLRGVYFFNNRFVDPEKYPLMAIDKFNEAIAIDPTFAKANLRLGYAHDHLYFENIDGSLDRISKAKYHFEKAFELDPEDPEMNEGRGWYEYHLNLNFEKARSIFRDVARKNPKNSTVLNALGVINGRLGNWMEAEESFDKSLSLQPKYKSTLLNYFLNLEAQRKYNRAKVNLDRILNISPQSNRAHKEMSNLILLDNGTAQDALSYFVNSRTDDPDHMRYLRMMERSFDKILESASDFNSTDNFNELRDLAMVHYFMKQQNESHAYAKRGIQVGEEHISIAPYDYKVIAELGLLNALIGVNKQALDQIKFATSVRNIEKDALLGPELELIHAKVLCVLGENEKCINLLNRLLSIPAYVTANLLKIDPIWDPLRNNQAFQDLLAAQVEARINL